MQGTENDVKLCNADAVSKIPTMGNYRTGDSVLPDNKVQCTVGGGKGGKPVDLKES